MTPLAQVYRRFGEIDGAEISPLYARVAVAVSESGEALRAIESGRRMGCSAGLDLTVDRVGTTSSDGRSLDGSALRAGAVGRC